MKNKKLIIFNILFIAFLLISVFSVNVFATENVVVNENNNGVVHMCCDTPEQKAIVLVQATITVVVYVLWGISIFKLIKKDKKTFIILLIIGFVLCFISGFLGMFRCA